jgi:hypothetical protein
MTTDWSPGLSLYHYDQTESGANFLSSRYRGLFRGQSRDSRLTTHLHLEVRLRMGANIRLVPCICCWLITLHVSKQRIGQRILKTKLFNFLRFSFKLLKFDTNNKLFQFISPEWYVWKKFVENWPNFMRSAGIWKTIILPLVFTGVKPGLLP